MSHSRPEEQLILWSAATSARRESRREHATHLAARVNWQRLGELLRIRRLLPTVGPQIVGLGDVDEQFELAVAHALESGRRQGVFLRLVSDRTIGALADAGIRATALKGPVLCEALYGDLGRRPAGDVDLLVAREQLAEAVEVVRGMGYAAPSDPLTDGGLPLLHFALVHGEGRFPPIELHWRIHWYERYFARERLLVPEGQQASTWRPAPIDELAALLLFYARDGFISLRHAADIGAWWDAFGDELHAGALDEQISAYRALKTVLLASARVAEKTVGAPLTQAFGHGAKLGVRGAVAVRLADPYPHSSEVQIYADMGLIDGLLTPWGGIRDFFRRQLAPTDGVVEHARAPRSRRAGSAISHGIGTLGRYGVALVRLLRLRPTARSG